MAARDRARMRAYLSQLNTEQLKELLRTDIESNEENDDEMIFAILEVMEEREQTNPTGQLPDVSKAWQEFQAYYNTPEGEGRSLYPAGGAEEEEKQKSAAVPSRRPSRRYPLHILGQSQILYKLHIGCK